ncbi:hypothetical protein AGMMS49546_37750 [Spirochaetia bacterium]|nr:hypothetical protein AGMMS49546_37750 [Spirochaetia bacterium]
MIRLITGVLAASLLVLSCGSQKDVLDEPPIITSATYQHTQYNGKPQPIEAAASRTGTAPFIITYFPSEDALLKDEGGTTEPPVVVGQYYARIERPAGKGYAAGPNVKVEYYIQKAFVTITAEEKQSALYNGDPRQAQASADPPLPLSFSYYPSREAREAASPSLMADAATAALKDYTRAEQAPIEQGTYYVTVYYPGDANYLFASKDVELTIRPSR